MTKEDYMHLPKERLAEMLAERDLIQTTPMPVYVPYEPYIPWWMGPIYSESTITSGDNNDNQILN